VGRLQVLDAVLEHLERVAGSCGLIGPITGLIKMAESHGEIFEPADGTFHSVQFA
jgi:hypothetical protein